MTNHNPAARLEVLIFTYISFIRAALTSYGASAISGAMGVALRTPFGSKKL